MKKSVIIILIISLIIVIQSKSQQANQSIDIPKEWKFQTGDNPEFMKPEYKDQDWKKINTADFWEHQGYEGYDGIAWYRTKIKIPSSLKKNGDVIKSVRISLGLIDDQDIIYLNGQNVGSTLGWDIERTYQIPYELIHWDQENVIAVRVNDTGGGGGMYEGPYSIGNSLLLSDNLTVETKDKPLGIKLLGNLKFSRTFFFNFKGSIQKVDGTLEVKVVDRNTKIVLFQKKKDVSVAGNNTSYSINGEIKSSKASKAYQMDYSFYSKSFPDTLKKSTLFSYNTTTRENEKVVNPLVKNRITDKSDPFDLQNIKFGGYLAERVNDNLYQRLLNIDETGILECYYNRPGKQEWVGEYPGKYLHAAARVWRFSKNAQLKIQMDRIVDILIGCQLDDGYLGTYLPADYWTKWDVWAHKYNILGLLSYYSVTGYKPALEACVKMGDLLCRTFGENPGQRRIIDNSPHLGMASTSVLEPMTYLYRFTGDKKYLDFCNYIVKAYDYEKGPKIISTLTTIGKVDKTANGKAYEMMSNLTGVVKLYQLTGNEKLLKATENAWNDISRNKLYITGTSSKGEMFQEDSILPAGNDVHMGEGCVTTTWLQFSQALYYLTGESKYINEIEKTIYNHLLAAENPQTGCVSYYTALQGKKPYRCNIDGNCCLASIPRAIAAIPELAYSKNMDNGFDINIYTTGKITDKIFTKDGKEIAVQCNIQSAFPEGGESTITINPETKSVFRLSLHVPDWCKNYKAVVNGKTLVGIPGQYLDIEQKWEKNSVISVSFDMTLQKLDGGLSYPGYMAFKFGTQVLAVDQALNPEIKDLDQLSISSTELKTLGKSILPKEWLGDQVYQADAFYAGKPVVINLVPFADASQTGGDIRVWIKKK